MIWRVFLLISIMAVLPAISYSIVFAQDINTLKTGVVRIENSRLNEVGTGFIVKVDGNQVYIVTAAHVVKGDQHPSIYLFNQQHDGLQAEVLDREEDDIKGLALLRLKVPTALASEVTALKISYTSQLHGGEDIKVIGFPDGTAFWTVGSGSIARIEGRNLVFSGAIRGGNSGGPVIFNGLVIGLITDVSQSSAYAARGEVIEPYINGIVQDLITVTKPIDEIKVGACRPYPVFHPNTKGRLTSWTSDNGVIIGTSDNSTVVETYYVCTYTLPQPARRLTVKFSGGLITFSASGGSGGGLGLLVYNGEPDYIALQTWDHYGDPKGKKWWLKKEKQTTQIDAERLELEVNLGEWTNRVSVVLMLADPWDSQSVRVQINGISIKLK